MLQSSQDAPTLDKDRGNLEFFYYVHYFHSVYNSSLQKATANSSFQSFHMLQYKEQKECHRTNDPYFTYMEIVTTNRSEDVNNNPGHTRHLAKHSRKCSSAKLFIWRWSAKRDRHRPVALIRLEYRGKKELGCDKSTRHTTPHHGNRRLQLDCGQSHWHYSLRNPDFAAEKFHKICIFLTGN